VVEWLTLLRRIRDVPVSYLGPKTGYPEWGFPWCSLVHPGKFWDSALNYVTTASYHTLSHSLFIYNHFIRRYIVWVIEKTSLNKLKIKNKMWEGLATPTHCIDDNCEQRPRFGAGSVGPARGKLSGVLEPASRATPSCWRHGFATSVLKMHVWWLSGNVFS
jgi:hypothetical protein